MKHVVDKAVDFIDCTRYVFREHIFQSQPAAKPYFPIQPGYNKTILIKDFSFSYPGESLQGLMCGVYQNLWLNAEDVMTFYSEFRLNEVMLKHVWHVLDAEMWLTVVLGLKLNTGTTTTKLEH